MLSRRRVKKGPGRRPQSAKRRRFVELRERGWSISAAAREVGVSRSSVNNWSRGYKTYRRSMVVGFVPALDRLAVREISSRFLSQDERIEIADLRQAGHSIRAIAGKLDRSHRRSHESCAATLPKFAERRTIDRSMHIAGRPLGVPAITADASKTIPSCGSWLPACFLSGGVHNRSAGICIAGFPPIGRCVCAANRSIKPSTSPDQS